jgi:hypothetical protein
MHAQVIFGSYGHGILELLLYLHDSNMENKIVCYFYQFFRCGQNILLLLYYKLKI